MLLQRTEREYAPIERKVSEDRVTRLLLELMREEDRELLTLWAQGHCTVRSLARVLGCHSGTVSRRLRLLRARLEDPVVRAIVICERELPARHREVAVRVLCHGEKLQPVAVSMGVSRQQVQRVLDEVRGWAKLRGAMAKR